jgi:hypothetical protein
VGIERPNTALEDPYGEFLQAQAHLGMVLAHQVFRQGEICEHNLNLGSKLSTRGHMWNRRGGAGLTIFQLLENGLFEIVAHAPIQKPLHQRPQVKHTEDVLVLCEAVQSKDIVEAAHKLHVTEVALALAHILVKALRKEFCGLVWAHCKARGKRILTRIDEIRV